MQHYKWMLHKLFYHFVPLLFAQQSGCVIIAA